ncbi:diguanylate cyclase [Zoogloea sp. LCSB751]|uniref:diguanylate cyclase domain-containing protein n=1 Tax=Zoogloea sp. LCSB751 TaxID=1965277 RepID=UPI0009A51718|nr:diguanylate cyclase [Zoogloea sp. LCSB751]
MKIPLRHLERLLPVSVGLVSLCLTSWLWLHERQGLDARLQTQFDFSVRQTTTRIEQRLAACKQMLRGVRGLFEASSHVNDDDFRRYVNVLTEGADFAGLQIMAYTPLPAGGVNDNGPLPIAYVAPDTPANRSAIGRDMYADPLRREAMQQTRDAGIAAMTRKIVLLVNNVPHQAGFAMYQALYAKDQPIDSPTARRQALRGWVHVAFRLEALMASLYGEGIPGLALRIYDGDTAAPDALIFDSHPQSEEQTAPRFTTLQYISFPQHNWTLAIRSTPEFEQQRGFGSTRIIAVAGTSLSLLLALLTWQLVTGRSRAFAHAQAMTSELRESEERMRHMAQHDPLTHLPNRALFADRLQSALARARRERTQAGLMFVDLDRFKPVNDAYGHAIGDKLLIAATARMRECLREADTLARMGGDEFVVLLPHIDVPLDARRVAERILSALSHPFEVDGLQLQISASIGIGLFPDHGDDDVSLMKSADNAMYRAKDEGRACLVFAD